MPADYCVYVFCRGEMVYADVIDGRRTAECCVALAAEAASVAGFALAESYERRGDRMTMIAARLYRDGAIVTPRGQEIAR